MKTKILKLCILSMLLFILSVFIYTGCSSKYGYSAQQERTEIYNSFEESITYINCCRYTTQFADYYFETNLNNRQKDSFIDTAEQILSSYSYDKVKFVVGTSLNTAYVGDVRDAKNSSTETVDTIFFNIKDFTQHRLLLELNARRFGEKTPFGLLYAYSFGQCVESKYDSPTELNDKKFKDTINGNKDILDLNAFVFLSSFTTKTEKEAAQTLSIKLYEQIGLQKLHELFQIEDSGIQQSILSLHIKAVCYIYGISTEFNIGMKDWSFYNTQKYIVAENSGLSVRFFITPHYKALSDEKNLYLKNYSDLKLCFEKSASSFVEISKFVGNTSFAPADFYISNEFEWSQTYGSYCVIREFLNIPHEYSHIAMWDKERSDIYDTWTVEGIASYCGILLSDYYTEMKIYQLMKYLGTDEYSDKVYDLLIRHAPAERVEMWDILAYAYESEFPYQTLDQGTWILPEQIAPSFCNYLIETYGKRNFMRLCTESFKDETDIYGKSLDDLRSEWYKNLQKRYG